MASAPEETPIILQADSMTAEFQKIEQGILLFNAGLQGCIHKVNAMHQELHNEAEQRDEAKTQLEQLKTKFARLIDRKQLEQEFAKERKESQSRSAKFQDHCDTKLDEMSQRVAGLESQIAELRSSFERVEERAASIRKETDFMNDKGNGGDGIRERSHQFVEEESRNAISRRQSSIEMPIRSYQDDTSQHAIENTWESREHQRMYDPPTPIRENVLEESAHVAPDARAESIGQESAELSRNSNALRLRAEQYRVPLARVLPTSESTGLNTPETTPQKPTTAAPDVGKLQDVRNFSGIRRYFQKNVGSSADKTSTRNAISSFDEEIVYDAERDDSVFGDSPVQPLRRSNPSAHEIVTSDVQRSLIQPKGATSNQLDDSGVTPAILERSIQEKKSGAKDNLGNQDIEYYTISSDEDPSYDPAREKQGKSTRKRKSKASKAKEPTSAKKTKGRSKKQTAQQKLPLEGQQDVNDVDVYEVPRTPSRENTHAGLTKSSQPVFKRPRSLPRSPERP